MPTTVAVMKKAVDDVERELDELLDETKRKIDVTKRAEFLDQANLTREKLAEVLTRGVEECQSTHTQRELKDNNDPPPSDYISRLSKKASVYTGSEWSTVDPKWHGLNAKTETLYRRLCLLRPANQGVFEAIIMWMAERGEVDDLDLLHEIKDNPPIELSEDTEELIEIARIQICERVYDPNKEVQLFFGLDREDFFHAIVAEENGGNTRLSDHANSIMRKLQSIKESLNALFEQDEITRWLHTSNSLLNNKTPVEAIGEGQIDDVLDILIGLEEGIHN